MVSFPGRLVALLAVLALTKKRATLPLFPTPSSAATTSSSYWYECPDNALASTHKYRDIDEAGRIAESRLSISRLRARQLVRSLASPGVSKPWYLIYFRGYRFLQLIGDSGVGKSCLLLRFAVSTDLKLKQSAYRFSPISLN